VSLLLEIRAAFETPATPVWSVGNVGRAATATGQTRDERGRGARLSRLADRHLRRHPTRDLVSAFTMNYVEEAIRRGPPPRGTTRCRW